MKQFYLPQQAHRSYDVLQFGEMNGVSFEYVNEDDDFQPEEDKENSRFHDMFQEWQRELKQLSSCEFCGSEMFTVRHRLRDDIGEELCTLTWCQTCRFWAMVVGKDNLDAYEEWTNLIAVSHARQFEKELPEGCGSEISQFIRREPSFLQKVSPRSLERFVRDVFRANFEDGEAIHVGRPGDGGVDVVFVESGGKEWLIQVKRRERASAVEGFSTVQQLAGTLLIENRLNGIVVSTADHFSAKAYSAVKKLKKQRYIVELYDRGVLNRMIDPLLPDVPWDLAVQQHTEKSAFAMQYLVKLERKKRLDCER